MSFELPFGATATAHLYDSFHHLIATQQFNVTSGYNDIPIAANVTSVSFIDSQTSGSFSGEIISSNGYNASFPDPMIVGTGYKYSYSVSAINPQTYELDCIGWISYVYIYCLRGLLQGQIPGIKHIPKHICYFHRVGHAKLPAERR